MVNTKRGFTVIELLISVSIMAILVGITLLVFNPSAASSKARDSRRINDIKYISSALEFYRIDNRFYPNTNGTFITITGSDSMSTALVPNYMRSIPVDPKNNNNSVDPCAVGSDNKPVGYRYNYRSNIGATTFVVTAQMEIAGSATMYSCSKLRNYSCGSNSYCVGFENKTL